MAAGVIRSGRMLVAAVTVLVAAAAACAAPATVPDSDPPMDTRATPTAADGCPLSETPKRQLRGAWIASVANINWPSQAGLPAAQQQAELRSLLDQVAALRFNAVFLQVRPAADAFWPA